MYRLSAEHLDELKEQIRQKGLDEGDNFFEIFDNDGDLYVEVNIFYSYDGYLDNDYYNGTGYFEVTEEDFDVTISIHDYSQGDDIEYVCCSEQEREIRDYCFKI